MRDKNIAIIPARGGSKRIPKKNIREFCGKPIIAYSIEAALASNLFDEVMVSTDDKIIADIAIQYGAAVPFMRSEKNADDYSTTFDVLEEVLKEYESMNRNFTYGCCIYSTAAFISTALLHKAYKKLIEENFDSVYPVAEYSSPMWRSLKIEDGKITMWWPENLNKRSQDLPKSYHDAGQFYWFDTEKILQAQTLYTQNSGAVIIDDLHVQDIDTLQDWQLAELKYKFLHSKGNE
ncbi:MAG TPA: pseudaminic acid cytidylyltransferase [Parafilimonas sp.]|nr:pseudaminic acid cytidylyltransferase [Parafilimonas sp.]